MENYFLTLTGLKKAILEDNIDSFRQLNTDLIGEEEQITLGDFRDDARNPIRKTNLVILASKYNRLKILKYLFDLETRILNNLSIIRTILPDDEDEEHHNAFYYALRWSNIELLRTLIKKWPNNYFDDLQKLDEILSRAYDELQLKNVPLSNKIEIYVEQKLINLRFFPNDDNVASDINYTEERIKLLLQNISLLKTDYSKQEKVDGKFLFVAKSIAQNIHILKQRLKSTFNVLPWEEMEFCLVSFISSHIKSHEINFFFRATLNKSKILNHLENFAEKLEDRKKIIKDTTGKPFNFSRSQRAEVVAGIISNHPRFEELYTDYRQIRDIYSLEKINDSINLALAADPKKTEERLIITRVLQVIGENVKNTLGSPNLSNATSDFLLLSLPKNTRQIIMGLRDSLSHDDSLSKRMEMEENPDINFFINIKNDTKKVGDVINNILFNKKVETVRGLLNQIVDGETIHDIRDVSEVLSSIKFDEMLPSTFKMLEHEKLEILLQDLSNNITEITNYEESLLNEMHSIIDSVGTQSKNNGTNYSIGFQLLKSLILSLNDSSESDQSAKSLAKKVLQNFTSIVEPNNIQEFSYLLARLHLSVAPKNKKQKVRNKIDGFNDLDLLLIQMNSTAELEICNIKWLEELKKKLNDKGSIINTHKQRETSNIPNNDQLILKLSKLKAILNNYTLSGSLIINKLLCYKRDRKIQAVVEMLVLDIMSILGSDKLENNLLLLDDHTPLLTGRSLRNHLAHDNALFDVLSSDLSIAVILNAGNLSEENLIKSTKKIGKVISDDISKLEDKYNQGLVTITNQEKMFVASEEGNLESLENCIKDGADINGRSINLWTTLHFAAKGGSLEVVKFIHDQNVNVNLTDNRGQTPLHVAAACGRQDIVEYFINKAGLCVDVQNDDYRTPLHVAAQKGHNNIVEVLLKNKANTVILDIEGSSPLCYAIRNDHNGIAKILFEKNLSVDINKTMRDYKPLYEAAKCGNLEFVNFLLRSKVEVNVRNYSNCVPLHIAAEIGDEEIVNALILKGADVNARSMNGSSPLYYAVQNGSEKIVKILLPYGANVDAAEEKYHCTPLNYAVQQGYLEIVKTLLINKANPNAATVKGMTALHFAAHNGHLEITATLLEHGVDIHAKDEDNYTPLHYAVEIGHKEVAELLIQKIGDLNVYNNYLTILHEAAQNGHKDIVELLINNKAEVNTRDAGGVTPLHEASVVGNRDIIELLIKNEADVNARASNGTIPLHLAAINGHGDVVDFLIKNGAEVNAESDTGDTPLLLAVIKGHKEVVQILAANEAINVDIKNFHNTPLFYAVSNNNNDIVKVLIENGANVAENGDVLLLAVFNGYTDIVKRLLLKHKDRINLRNAKNQTLLHIAAEEGHNKLVSALIRSGADVKSRSPTNVTPLHLAAHNGHINVVKVLLDNLANINVKDNKDRTPIECAVMKGHLKVVVMLLEVNKEIAMNIGDFTLLHIASQQSNLELIKYLVDEGFDMNAKDSSGSKPIHIAATEGYKDTVEYFISKGASINDTDGTKQTLLHCATTNGHLKVVKYLIAQGANINAKTTQGLTAMHIAVNFGSKDVIEVLLQYGAIYNAIDESHRTPSSTAKNTDVINLFESTDKLFEAAKRNSPLEVEDYIKAGAFINAKNVECDTPLYYAARKGYHEVVNVLLKNNANPNVVDNEGFTPLHYAAEFAHLKIIKALLSKNAVYNAVSKDGKKPSDFIGNEETNSLFKLVNEAFEDIKNGNLQVIDYLNKITDIDTVKAVMGACDGENRTLVVAAVHSNFSQVDQLKEISQGDLSVHITETLKLLDKGNSEIALGMLESAMEKRKEILGSDNPGTLDIQTHIAEALCELGDYPKALSILEEIFQKREKMLGLNYLDTLNTRGLIAYVLHSQRKDEEALNIYQEVYRKQKKILGPDHYDTVVTQTHMAPLLARLGKYEEALHMNRKVFKIQKARWGSDHVLTLQVQNDIAIELTKLRKFEEALKILKEIYKKRKKLLGVYHPDTLETLNNIGGVFLDQRKTHEALKAFGKVLHNRKKVSKNHPVILNTRCAMAYVLTIESNYLSAYKKYIKILDEIKKVFGPSHHYVVKVLDMIEECNVMFKLEGIEPSKVLHNLQNDINAAASNGDNQIVQRLLNDGADPNEYDIDGRTPLHHAVSYGHLGIMNILLQNGADVDRATDKVNTTLLHTATAKDCTEIVDVLLRHVSPEKLNEFINAKTTANGNTSLHIAVGNGALHIIKSLLKLGANYNIKNNKGKTALDLSKDQSEYNLLKLVEEVFEDAKNDNVQITGKLKPLT